MHDTSKAAAIKAHFFDKKSFFDLLLRLYFCHLLKIVEHLSITIGINDLTTIDSRERILSMLQPTYPPTYYLWRTLEISENILNIGGVSVDLTPTVKMRP